MLMPTARMVMTAAAGLRLAPIMCLLHSDAPAS
jgi:hypothetical protein